jgi:cobalt/nickel transport system permease protein
VYLDRLEFTHDALRRLDGRCRVISALVLIIAVVYAKSPYFITGLAVLSAVPLVKDIRITMARLLPVNLILVPIWLSVPFGLDAAAALRYTLRVNAAALLAMSLVVPMRIQAISRTLAALKTPRKLITLFVLTHRYLFVLIEGLATALTSMRLRGGRQRMLGEWKALSHVFAATLVKSADRSDRVFQAMTARGFTGTFPSIRLAGWHIRDALFLTGALTAAVCGMVL